MFLKVEIVKYVIQQPLCTHAEDVKVNSFSLLSHQWSDKTSPLDIFEVLSPESPSLTSLHISSLKKVEFTCVCKVH